MAGKTSPGFKITGLDKIADPNPVPENAPKQTSPLLSESDVIKAAMSGKAQIIGGEDHGFVDAATRPKSSGGSSILGGVDNFVSNVGGQVTEAVKPVADKLTPNLDQDLVAPVVTDTVNNVVDQVEGINVPTPNLDQDLTKVNTQTVQNALVDAGSAIQEQVVQSGAVAQQAAIDAASAAQTNAINTGTILSGGQSNPTLEAAADTVTNNTESLVAEATKYIENKVVPDVRNVFKDFESLTPRIEQTGMMLNPGTVQGTEGAGNPQLSADTPNLGDDQVFGDLEKATGKDSKLTEEERLRRIRRLLLNRYGRENTILTTGPGDTRSRRRYAI
jgi:hypothetical protein